MSSEFTWLREQLAIALFAPRAFARALARERYGLAGPAVAVAAGASLSLALDILVAASRGHDPLGFIPRILSDAFFLAMRLGATIAILAALTYAALRLFHPRDLDIDGVVSAVSFALAPLLFASPLALPALIEPGLGVAGIVGLVILVARSLYGLSLNMNALFPPRVALLVLAFVVGAGSVGLGDEIARAKFVAYGYAPTLAPELAAAPAQGTRVDRFGIQLTMPSDWHASEVRSGEMARFETDIDALAVRRTSTGALLTAGDAADEIGRLETIGMQGLSSQREIVRIDGRIVVDDRHVGRLEGKVIVVRQFTMIYGADGFALVFRTISPADPSASLARDATIAATWRIAGSP